MIFQRCSLPRPRCWLTFPISLTLFPYFCSHFSVLKLLSWILSLLCLLLAITSAFLHLLPSALTTLIIDLISLLFTNPVSSSIDFLCYPDFKLLIVTVITAFFISSNWLICCRWRKVIFFWPAFFLPTFFRWLLHTFLPRFPQVFLPRQKKKFLPLFFPTNNAILLTARVPVLHMFRFPSSSDSATPTTNFWIPTIQLIPRHLANSVHNFCPTTNFQTATTVTATCYSTGKHTKL